MCPEIKKCTDHVPNNVWTQYWSITSSSMNHTVQSSSGKKDFCTDYCLSAARWSNISGFSVLFEGLCYDSFK